MKPMQILDWPFEDPVRPLEATPINLARFRRVRDKIDEHIRAWLRQFERGAITPARR